MILALTPKVLIDLNGPEERMRSEQRQGVLLEVGKHADLGLVRYDGQEYYASLYQPPIPPCDEEAE